MKILMALMQLDIGGAETHVVELSKELKNRGHEVIIASNGGSYVPEIINMGIEHITVPLQNKNPQNVLKAFRLLKDIIKDKKPDIVHSHARIPSFILGKIRKNTKFNFVTTAHWVFTTRYGLKYITDWGEKTFAVSEDIKKYLIDNYKIDEKDITVTINGIDTVKFSPDVDKTAVLEELGINENDNIIVHVSRMDKSRSLLAHQLIEAARRLNDIVDNLKVIIVGGGDDFEQVKNEAEDLNKELGAKTIILTGARVDINELIAPAKLFVGVSRAALEAMAEEKCTIIAGNEGYIGLFDEEKLETCLLTNFCCRGCESSKVEKLSQDIGEFFGRWEEERDSLGKFARKTVIDNYSVKKMADDALGVYNSLLD